MFRSLTLVVVLLVGLMVWPLARADSTSAFAEVAQKSKSGKVVRKRKVSRKPKTKATSPRREVALRSSEIRDVEQRLEELGYWTGTVDGKLDETSRSALIAFQKVTGRARNGKLSRAERSAVMRASRPDPLETGLAHVEIDLRRQVLFTVDESGIVTRILPVSTGSGKDFFAEGYTRTAVTPPGRFTIQGKVHGWRKSALGRLYYPNYIIGGIAIHGYPSVPAKPASHGCIRIPMFAAKEFSRLYPVGTSVIVHPGRPEDPSLAEAGARGRDRE